MKFNSYAGYDWALDTVYLKLQEMSTTLKILAPEVLGIGYNNFQNYTNQINHGEYVYGYAYHLYHGGDTANPDAFISNLTTIATNYSGKPVFQTEYEHTSGWHNEVWLMHNCLVYGNISGFFHWTIVSTNAGSRAFVVLSGSTYTLAQAYWGFRQYSKAIHYGWKRVGAEVDAGNLLISAYISPEKDELSIVVINISYTHNDSLDLSVPGFDISGANILRTTNTEQCAPVGYYDGSTINLPIKSITTISTLEIDDVSGVEEEDYDSPNKGDISLAQNYPNPFNAATTIEYSIREADFVRLAIYDVSGQKVKSLVEEVMPAGKHTVNVEVTDLSSGVYFYRLATGGKNIQKKMVLIR